MSAESPKRPRLLIISDTFHARSPDGALSGWGPTIEEIDVLASLFETVRNIAVVSDEEPSAALRPYVAENVEVVGVVASGGETLGAKFGILRRAPRYIAAIAREVPNADVIHLRTPANIPLIGLLTLALLPRRQKRWVKYAGNWRPSRPDAWSYRAQRWLLRRNVIGGVVTVNGRWPGDGAHVRAFYNPTLQDADLAAGRDAARARQLCSPLRLLYVGRVEEPKGAPRAIEICKQLHDAGVVFELDVVGSGPQSDEIATYADRLGIAKHVRFHGWLGKRSLQDLYAAAHVFVLPTSASEGFPKVVSEAMAFGVVPIVGAVSSIPQLMAETGAGIALDPQDITGFVREIQRLCDEPERWREMSERGLAESWRFTYATYRRAVIDLLELDA